MTVFRTFLPFALGSALLWLGLPPAAPAATTAGCPLCPAIGAQTIGEQLQTMDVAVVARLAATWEPLARDEPNARFEIDEVLTGHDVLGNVQVIETGYYGSSPVGTQFLMAGIGPGTLTWNAPLRLDDEGLKYVRQVQQLPDDPLVRLAFFLGKLETGGELIATDAYDEFARAPYDEIRAIRDQLDREQLIAWVQSDQVPPTRRRLYFMLLGIAGDQAELPMLEQMLRQAEHDPRSALDAMIACYLSLAGADGLPLIEQRFLANAEATYSETYAAIQALRFHGTDADVVPRDQIVGSFRLLLDRPQLADLIIPDLARWEDWDSMDRLAELFREAKGTQKFIRVPIVLYLQACPEPRAKTLLEEFEKLDPSAVARASLDFGS